MPAVNSHDRGIIFFQGNAFFARTSLGVFCREKNNFEYFGKKMSKTFMMWIHVSKTRKVLFYGLLHLDDVLALYLLKT